MCEDWGNSFFDELEKRKLKQRLADAEANTQAAIDAALESVLQDAKWETMHNPSPEFERGMNMVIRVLNNHIGTNPLADAQKRIADLEKEVHLNSNAAEMWRKNHQACLDRLKVYETGEQ